MDPIDERTLFDKRTWFMLFLEKISIQLNSLIHWLSTLTVSHVKIAFVKVVADLHMYVKVRTEQLSNEMVSLEEWEVELV